MDCCCLYGGFLGVRGGKARLQRHAIGTHKRFGEVILLDAADRRGAHDGFGLGTQQPAGQIHPAALLRQQPGVRPAVGHIGGLERRTRQHPHQLQRGGACINEHKILGGDECCSRRGNAALFCHSQRFLGFHGRLVCQKTAVRQGSSSVHLGQPALPVQLGQIAPDGGFAGVQCLAQLLHRHGAFLVQLF